TARTPNRPWAPTRRRRTTGKSRDRSTAVRSRGVGHATGYGPPLSKGRDHAAAEEGNRSPATMHRGARSCAHRYGADKARGAPGRVSTAVTRNESDTERGSVLCALSD